MTNTTNFIKVLIHLNKLFVVILTGDAGVGKSNFLLRYYYLIKIAKYSYVKGIYENASSTIGVEFAYKVSTLKNKTRVKA